MRPLFRIGKSGKSSAFYGQGLFREQLRGYMRDFIKVPYHRGGRIDIAVFIDQKTVAHFRTVIGIDSPADEVFDIAVAYHNHCGALKNGIDLFLIFFQTPDMFFKLDLALFYAYIEYAPGAFSGRKFAVIDGKTRRSPVCIGLDYGAGAHRTYVVVSSISGAHRQIPGIGGFVGIDDGFGIIGSAVATGAELFISDKVSGGGTVEYQQKRAQ